MNVTRFAANHHETVELQKLCRAKHLAGQRPVNSNAPHLTRGIAQWFLAQSLYS